MKHSRKRAKTRAAAPDQNAVKAAEHPSFPVVGIGASAGGLEAFTELLRHLPENTGMAFVLVQHLDPTHGSVLREILARTTRIPVTEVTDGVAVEPNHIYVIPANTNMIIKGGVLRLAARELKRGQHMPIDHFLNSLANERGDLAISVILSGTASDGTLGSVAVKAAGGMTFAQDEKSAKYSSMPRNAIHAGSIDFVLPPKGIAQELVRIGRHPYIARVPAEPKAAPLLPSGDEMNTLFAMVREATGQKVQLEALRTQSALLELSHETVIVRDLQGKISFWNRGAEEKYGWKKEEALGKYKHDLLKPKFPKPRREIEAELLRTGYWEGEIVHTRRDGEARIVDSRWAVLRQEDGNTVVLEINSDISERKHSEEQLRRLSAHLMRIQDEERRRIARELHDSTGQKLAAMGMLLEDLAKHLGSNAKGAQALKELGNLLDGANREIRTVAQLLHPPELDLLGLVSATRTLVEGFSERSGIPVDFEAPAEMKRLEAGDLTLFRVVQECLTNIHRHSGAKRAKVRLSETPEAVTLEISDDGHGMAGKAAPEGEQDSGDGRFGVGILGMKERLSQLGGTLEISSQRKGTVVRAILPKTKPKVISA